MGRPDLNDGYPNRGNLNRRNVLAALGGLTVAGSLGFAALGTGADALASSARTRVRYWNLFQGGDGTNQVAMVDAFRKEHPDIAVKDSTLTWGGPYYTKLAMAAAGNRAPDLAVMHQGRVPGFAPGRLLHLGHRPSGQVRRAGDRLQPRAVEARRRRRQALVGAAPGHPRPALLLPQGRLQEGLGSSTPTAGCRPPAPPTSGSASSRRPRSS